MVNVSPIREQLKYAPFMTIAWPTNERATPKEKARVVMNGHDADDETRCEVIAIRREDGTWAFHNTAPSRTVVLSPEQVARLVAAVSPASPSTVVVSVLDGNGQWVHAPAAVRYNTELPRETALSLAKSLPTRPRIGG